MKSGITKILLVASFGALAMTAHAQYGAPASPPADKATTPAPARCKTALRVLQPETPLAASPGPGETAQSRAQLRSADHGLPAWTTRSASITNRRLSVEYGLRSAPPHTSRTSSPWRSISAASSAQV